MQNTTHTPNLPLLPSYTLKPLPPLFSFISDQYLSLAAPVVAYWGLSFIFHFIDSQDLFPQYRIHPSPELLKRNTVSKATVVRAVFVQQFFQSIVGIYLAGGSDVYGKEDYDIAVWASRIRLVQSYIPRLLAVVGIDALGLSKTVSGSYSELGSLFAGDYSSLWTATPAAWELFLAKSIYWVLTPAFQFSVAVAISETWQYFLHRLFHSNRWLYRTLLPYLIHSSSFVLTFFPLLSTKPINFIEDNNTDAHPLIGNVHSLHHKLYVPYCWGGLYTHPIEGISIDVVQNILSVIITGLTTRQATLLSVFTMYKSVTDHSGYSFPWDPLMWLSGNRSEFHDLHHQGWGLKVGFLPLFWSSISFYILSPSFGPSEQLRLTWYFVAA